MDEVQTEPPKRNETFEIDFEKYLEYTRDFEISEDQQREFISALWQIMMAFLDFKYGIHPVQSALKARQLDDFQCGNLGNSETPATNGLHDVIKSIINQSDDLKDSFQSRADPVGSNQEV